MRRDDRPVGHGEFRIRATRVGSRRPQVRFEPTPIHVVTAMLELARVDERDVLYDLGAGDGRVVMAAAERFGAHAVGIEISAPRVERAAQAARDAGVSHKARFVQADLFDADVRQATVVTLFLLPEVNLMLRPKLLRELAPGARILSYIHDMGDWKPQKASYTMDRLGWYHRIYLWTVPAPPPLDAPVVSAQCRSTAAPDGQ